MRPAGITRNRGHEPLEVAPIVRRNKPSSGEFARLWNELPAARQRAMLADLRAALGQVKAAGSINTVHEAMVGSHSHAHHSYGASGGDQNHGHEHTHGADGTPDANHDHGHASASKGRHIRFERGGVTVLNSVRRASPAWDRLVRDAQKGGQI